MSVGGKIDRVLPGARTGLRALVGNPEVDGDELVRDSRCGRVDREHAQVGRTVDDVDRPHNDVVRLDTLFIDAIPRVGSKEEIVMPFDLVRERQLEQAAFRPVGIANCQRAGAVQREKPVVFAKFERAVGREIDRVLPNGCGCGRATVFHRPGQVDRTTGHRAGRRNEGIDHQIWFVVGNLNRRIDEDGVVILTEQLKHGVDGIGNKRKHGTSLPHARQLDAFRRA